MRGTIYYKKWSNMPWWSRVHHIRKLHLNDDFDERFARFGHVLDDIHYNYAQHEKMERKPTMHWDDPNQKISDYDRMRFEFFRRLLQAFPNLAFVVQERMNQGMEPDWQSNDNPFLPFFTHFFRHLRKGRSPKDATDETIKFFRRKFDRQYAQLDATEIVAEENQGQSLMDYFSLQKLKESAFKARRADRDKELFDILRGKEFKYDDDYEPNYAVVNQNYLRGHIEEKRLTPEKVLSAEVAAKERQDINAFIERSKGLLWKYFDQVAKHDKVAGMSNEEVMLMIFTTPKAMERHFAPFVAKLVDNGVYLSNLGEPRFEKVQDKKFTKALKKRQELVKFALMLADLNYGYLHQQQMERQANALKDKIIDLNTPSITSIKRMNEQNIQELADRLKLSKSEADDLLSFVYYEQHEREKQIVQEPISKAKMDINAFLEDRNQRIDWANDFKESIFERNLRLQADWLKEQLVYTRTTPDQQEELAKRLVDAIRALRRTRFQFDKMAYKKAARIFFLEHMNIDFASESVDIERFEEYFKIPQEVFIRDPKEDHEYQRSKKATQKTLLVQDLEDPLRSGTHDPTEEYQADNFIWDAVRHREPKKVTGEKTQNSNLNRVYFEGAMMTRAEQKQWAIDNRDEDDKRDPTMMFLETRHARLAAKRALKTAENKAKKEKKRIKAAKTAGKL